jgi:glycosyltransferase involved in cell wall biosynthesis
MHADVAPLYVAADVVVFPATSPHQARPVLEAGAAAKPVVVADFPNNAEFLAHDVNGLTFPPGDSAALAVQLRRVLADRNLTQRLGHRNRAMTLARHDARAIGRRYASLLDRVAERTTSDE